MTEATNNTSGQPRKVQVSAEPLRQVLHALINAPHLIRELQATREPVALFADNPINVLIAEFEAGFAAPTAAAVVMPPSPYMPGVEPESMTDYERGEAQGRCDMWAEVARLNADNFRDAAKMVPADHVEQPRAMVVPEGCALVPLEPTEAMIDVAVSHALMVSLSGDYNWSAYMRDVWLSMLAAAPEQPAKEQGQ